ncbi:MAG: hypothetical protein ACE145_00180 [Terriglobia bacterium]
MRYTILSFFLGALMLAWGTQDAQAGAIRYAGKKISNGTVVVAQTTADAAQATGSGVATVGKATGGATKSGVVAVGSGVKATPGLVARGTKAVGKGITKALW